MKASAIGLEAIVTRLGAITMLEAIARLQAAAIRSEAIAIGLEAIATRTATRLETIASVEGHCYWVGGHRY